MQFTTHSGEETLQLGERLGKLLKPGDVVLLFGELGAGKTKLTQGIAQGLGLQRGEYVRSPSFTLVNEYRGHCPIYHIDLYRIESYAEIENLGLEETFFGDGVTLVEWAEKLYRKPGDKTTLGFGIEPRMEITIAIPDESVRQFDIQPEMP
ncbi:tRNA (adenosine(37)-N6)-threonylcarbamoyltransferase complex ATPase subunit type 1 TsaE [Candidatus Peregrinibacteria bacterium]|nr:tRNA (adenosine(37)-N6)-threonylcarbamoyltransferase complex ATPase subunit type 1 TsaE [Candidatus Peregrinibacteria bacterium]